VNLLSSALPGIRDIRAPLVAGYVWLLFIWLVWDPGEDFVSVHGTVGDIIDLAHTIGPIATAAAVSVLAFFVGALSQSIATLLASWVRVPVGVLNSTGNVRVPRRRRGVPA
jgi:hypothetical protein